MGVAGVLGDVAVAEGFDVLAGVAPLELEPDRVARDRVRKFSDAADRLGREHRQLRRLPLRRQAQQ
jgi:hypothetical protein